jgi:DNA-directed RNA polymerase beta subunit
VTPINNNTNLQNAINVCVKITDDGVLYSAYNKEFQRISLYYIDYLNAHVVSSEFVDYKNRQLKPDPSGMVEVKYRMKRKMVKVEEIDFIDLEPDYRLSETTRRIPFINYTDSVRISMGTSILFIKCHRKIKPMKILLTAGTRINSNQQLRVYILRSTTIGRT